LRSFVATRSDSVQRSSGSPTFVGCICGLGATPTRARSWLAGAPRRALLIADDACDCAQGLVHRRGGREDLRDIGFDDDNMTARHSRGVGVATPLAEIVFREYVVGGDTGAALSGLLHSGGVRDGSRAELMR